jgi:secondary thiamine-phosphate synthase enzyme
MSVLIKRLTLETRGFNHAIDVTGALQQAVKESGVTEGLVTVFVPGSTAGVTTIEYESGALRDLSDALERAAPADARYEHNRRWGDGNGFSHVRAALLGPSVSVPFSKGRLLLGTWQQVVVVDCDNRPRSRQVVIQVLGG